MTTYQLVRFFCLLSSVCSSPLTPVALLSHRLPHRFLLAHHKVSNPPHGCGIDEAELVREIEYSLSVQ